MLARQGHESRGTCARVWFEGVADMGSSTWTKYKPLDGGRENEIFALVNSNL